MTTRYSHFRLHGRNLIALTRFVMELMNADVKITHPDFRNLWLLVILLAWGGISGYLSKAGVYSSDRFLRPAPGYWLPFSLC